MGKTPVVVGEGILGVKGDRLGVIGQRLLQVLEVVSGIATGKGGSRRLTFQPLRLFAFQPLRRLTLTARGLLALARRLGLLGLGAGQQSSCVSIVGNLGQQRRQVIEHHRPRSRRRSVERGLVALIATLAHFRPRPVPLRVGVVRRERGPSVQHLLPVVVGTQGGDGCVTPFLLSQPPHLSKTSLYVLICRIKGDHLRQ